MGIPYEDAVKKVHPSAKNFQPVKRAWPKKGICGWIFQVDAQNGSIGKFSWVTRQLEVSSDITVIGMAKDNLRTFTEINRGARVLPKSPEIYIPKQRKKE